MKKEISNKYSLNPRNVVLVLGVIYTLLTILAITSYISSLNNISTTPVSFSGVLSAIWWQLLMIALFFVTYCLYAKNKVFGSLLEIIMGIAMLVYMIVSIITIGANLFAIMIELIYPLVLVFHGLNSFKKIIKKNKKPTT